MAIKARENYAQMDGRLVHRVPLGRVQCHLNPDACAGYRNIYTNTPDRNCVGHGADCNSHANGDQAAG